MSNEDSNSGGTIMPMQVGPFLRMLFSAGVPPKFASIGVLQHEELERLFPEELAEEKKKPERRTRVLRI